jgi:hypothetical protein|tara:strand:+ start:1052 stop:1702 length:651 start_codon:yes stop_codon:yes gene_type:complete
MKLITEVLDQELQYISEEGSEVGKKSHYIEGVFMQGDIKNRNGRLYPMKTLEKEVNRYNEEFVNKNRAYGELGHPDGPTINLERVSHMIKSLRREGNDIIGKAKIMETPMGSIVKNLMNEGAKLGVSSRGMGSLIQKNGLNEVQGDFMLATAADIVADPSAPNAFVEGIMEGVEFYYDSDRKTWMSEQIKSEVKKMSAKGLEEQKLSLFKRFINNL